MLVTEKIKMVWCGANKKYFTDKGYRFTKMGEKFIINVTDLKPRASVDVIAKCDVCGVEKKTRYSTYTKSIELNGEYLCGKCSRIKKAKYKVQDIEKCLKEYGYTLVDDMGYHKMHDKIKIRCDKGHEYIAEFNSFKCGYRCRKCMFDKWIGEGNPRYNPNLSEEQREENKSRHSDYKYRRWFKSVFKRDRYTCCICGIKGKEMNAHHLNGFDKFKEDRLKVENGVTLCKECHMKFHKAYGYGNNTEEQFYEFIINNVC